METKQQQKSALTRQKLHAAMVSLFLEKGYEATSIKEIAAQAGYAVGSFYRHWPGKQEAFIDFWEDYVSTYIRDSIKKAPTGYPIDAMVDYLVERSDQFSRSEVTIKLAVVGRILITLHGYQRVDDYSVQYRRMLVNFLRHATPCRDKMRLNSTAGILHTILDNHAMQHALPSLYEPIDNETLKTALKAIIRTLMP